MAFKKPPMGKRGYDEEDVDAFLDEVEQELIRLLEENAALADRVQQGGPSPVAAGPSAAAALNAELAAVAAQLERLQAARARAEEQARSLQGQLEQARRAAADAPPAAGDRIAPVLMMAQRTADDHLRDAEQNTAKLLAEARDKAAKVTSEAQLKAKTMESDARRNHTDSINSIEIERAALLDEIDRLGRLAESYRTALRGHITQQVQDLDGVPNPS
jgi:DivIVA domain-containing protein